MMNVEETKMDMKREEIIQKLVDNGVFKIHGKQLYELPLYALMKEYMITTK
ncbi:Fur-regulated basic protein FbpA [Sporosarcina sp. FSL W7-1349]|uniref:Fur-regulated basic protein FbpA n=1 Tax=Sporosarcina sp. FSL W7-1349 TaxID=2921561 RepID=UPI0030FAE168